MNPNVRDNLRTPTSEEAREMQRKGARKRKENNQKRKLVADVLYQWLFEQKYKAKDENGKTINITGEEIIRKRLPTDLARCNTNQLVSLLRLFADTIDGQKINISGEVKGENLNDDDRKRMFEELMKK